MGAGKYNKFLKQVLMCPFWTISTCLVSCISHFYFRTLPFNVFVRRAAEVKHTEYFMSEVMT